MIQKKKNTFKNHQSFHEAMKGIRKMKQDTIFHIKSYKLYQNYLNKRNIIKQDIHIQFFIKNFSTKNIKRNPVSYIRSKKWHHELIKLKNKKYTPEFCLDCHGLNQMQVKKELGRLFFLHQKDKIFCFAIIHGHGKNILKNIIPIWLSQHPDIIAFYQPPKSFGYNTTLFVLLQGTH